MTELLGKGIYQGIAIGVLYFPKKDDIIIHKSGTNLIICTESSVSERIIKAHGSKIIGICITKGSEASHAVITAKAMGIPVIIGFGGKLSEEFNGKEAIIDGSSGRLYIEPDDGTVAEMMQKRDDELRRKAVLQNLIGKENVTSDGRKIEIFANAGSLSDINSALENDAGGIGLFRSEYLFLDDNDAPTEELQFQYYKRILEKMGDKRVVIRTFDFGGDKQAEYLNSGREENPALGYRGIRICLENTDFFKVQLRALYRASIFGNLGIILPMIISPDEVLQTKSIIKEVTNQLASEGIPFKGDIEIGIMIETPAGAIISDKLAKEADFFCIGTNDLTQYLLAADRGNPKLGKFYDPYHPAILRLIKMVTENAHANGISVGICGELGHDSDLIQQFIEMGIDGLSVEPSYILPLREKIRNL